MMVADCPDCGFEKGIVGMGGCNCKDTLLAMINRAGARLQIENAGDDLGDFTDPPSDSPAQD